jgi:hypothetical protein
LAGPHICGLMLVLLRHNDATHGDVTVELPT